MNASLALKYFITKEDIFNFFTFSTYNLTFKPLLIAQLWSTMRNFWEGPALSTWPFQKIRV